MTVAQSKIFHFHLHALAGVFIALTTYAFTACSNSELAGLDAEEASVIHCRDSNGKDSSTQENIHKTDSLQSNSPLVNSNKKDTTAQENLGKADFLQTISSQTDSTIIEPENIDSAILSERICDTIIDYLPLDDTEYPYAGIPRIVIETENHQAIKDRETEIPAKLQIWGEKAPESEIMELTIKGRGNSTWGKPKKPYTVKFEKKQSFLGMAKAKKWVFLANYLDRTLIRNATALEIARKTSLEWVPSGKFAEVVLNGKYQGNYFICEKIQIDENRLNIGKNAYLLEFDKNYDEEFKFKSPIKKLPVNIKNPNTPSKEQFAYITTYIDTIECILYGECKNLTIENYLDFQSFADYLIVYELTENSEPLHPKSVYMYKDSGPLKAGPVWDFDWGTFSERKVYGWRINNALWYSALLKNQTFRKKIQDNWLQYKTGLEQIPQFIDSLADYIKESNDGNIALWPIKVQSSNFTEKDKNFEDAIQLLKHTYSARISVLDSLFSSLH